MFFRKLVESAQQNKRWLGAASVAGLGVSAYTMTDQQNRSKFIMPLHKDSIASQDKMRMGGRLINLFNNMAAPQIAECADNPLPVYRRQEVQKEARVNGKVWVTYKNGVYDLTVFAKSHPGGSEKLLMAKGGPIEPWWQQYPFHKQELIIGLLAQYKIGELDPRDVLDEKDLPDFKDL